MKKHLSKKRVVLAAIVTVALAIASGVAYAYWTSTGAGTGSATNASLNGTLVLKASFANGLLTPGATEPVSFTADNGGSSNLYVGTVTPVVSVSNAYDVTSNPNGCKASWFSIASVDENQTIPANTIASLGTNGSITFNDSLTEKQDGCKGALVTLTLTS